MQGRRRRLSFRKTLHLTSKRMVAIAWNSNTMELAEMGQLASTSMSRLTRKVLTIKNAISRRERQVKMMVLSASAGVKSVRRRKGKTNGKRRHFQNGPENGVMSSVWCCHRHQTMETTQCLLLTQKLGNLLPQSGRIWWHGPP